MGCRLLSDVGRIRGTAFIYMGNKSPIIKIYPSPESVVGICATSLLINYMGYSGSLIGNNGALGGLVLNFHFWHVSHELKCCATHLKRFGQ